MQRAQRLPTRKRRISGTGVLHSLFRCQLDDRIQARVDDLDPLQMGLDNLFGAKLALTDATRQCSG